MKTHALESIAQALVPSGKGILAADEGEATIQRRFASINVECTTATRRAYREMLFTTPGAEEFISGVILFEETLRQSTQDGIPFPALLANKGIISGIKADTGPKDLAGFPGETVTEGLDGLRERLTAFRDLGAQFGKWRAVINVGDGFPTQCGIDANAHALARYAAICQEVGLVPIVEPEVFMEGTHTIERCEEITEAALKRVYFELHAHRVVLEGTLLKPSMVLSGTHCSVQAGIEEVAEATVRCFRRAVPAAVPGIVFLSGGQSATVATAHLNAMNAIGNCPWELSFSYGRALQAPTLEAWGENPADTAKAQNTFYHRARCNGAARYGKYTEQMESRAA